jgi:uncharacterized protein YdhG (YjbR/CyaY superfamily)
MKKPNKKQQKSFSKQELADMRERIQEIRSTLSGEEALRIKISEMKEPDRTMAKRVHAIVMASASSLTPKTWYGMPAYAKNDKVVCFFQSGKKYQSRYCTLGFTDRAHLDAGNMWATGFALKKLTAEVEAKIRALVKKAAR